MCNCKVIIKISGHKLCGCNNLQVLYPEVAKEWHPTKNDKLTPKDVFPQSGKKYWWVCNNNHEWLASCNRRIGNGCGCPYCDGKLVCIDNCLATRYPNVAKEWHPNKNNGITPHDVISGSHKKHWWMCNKGHEWQAATTSRTNSNSGCPFCANQKVSISNCLATVCPEIVEMWHPTKNGDLTPFDVMPGSKKKVWWMCQKQHEWLASCNKRTSSGRNCPYCSNQKVWYGNCLQTLFPEIAKEWHPTKNSKLTPNDVIAGSDKKYLWVCKYGHTWKASCCKRTQKESRGCPVCNESKGEKRITKFLEDNSIKYKRQYKFPDCKNQRELPFDFAILEQGLFLIEFQGQHHYKPVKWGYSMTQTKSRSNLASVKKRDKIKSSYAKKYKIPLLIIPHWEIDNIEKLLNNFINNVIYIKRKKPPSV